MIKKFIDKIDLFLEKKLILSICEKYLNQRTLLHSTNSDFKISIEDNDGHLTYDISLRDVPVFIISKAKTNADGDRTNISHAFAKSLNHLSVKNQLDLLTRLYIFLKEIVPISEKDKVHKEQAEKLTAYLKDLEKDLEEFEND